MLETVIIILSVIIDQITKYIASIKLLSPYDIIPGVIRLHYVKNTGMAFGLLKDQTAFLAAVSVIMTGVMIYALIKYSKECGKLFSVSLSMIAGGAAGNAIDRIIRGFVIDFIDPVFVDFAVFNAADSFITIGSILFIIYLIFYDKTIFRNSGNDIKSS